MAVIIEDVIEKTGGCGRFQIIVGVFVHFAKGLLVFTVLFMMFGGLVPDWWCVEDLNTTNSSLVPGIMYNYRNYKSCRPGNDSRTCQKFMFDSSVRTIVSEWNLVCDSTWIVSAITSIQMAGLVVGNTLGGHSADFIGRKPTFLGTMAVNTLLNAVIIFSPSWVVFTAIRFFMGVACGFQLTTMYSIQCEFAPTRWRSFIVAVPSWPLFTMVFSLVCWLLQDWKQIHLVTAGLGAFSVVTCCFVRESFRWRVAHDQVDRAFDIITFVAKVNRRPPPDVCEMEGLVKNIAQAETTEHDRKYSFLDLLRSRTILKYTIYMSLIWFSVGLSNYGIQFGMSAISGSFYGNVAIYSSMVIPLLILLHFLQNSIGRRKTFGTYFFVFTLNAAIAAIAYRFEESETRNMVSRVCALIAIAFASSAVTSMQVLTIEIYPTVVRNIGYGFQNTMSRVGAIVGPQLVFLETMVPGMMYSVCTVLGIVSILLLKLLPETRCCNLKDKLHEVSTQTLERRHENGNNSVDKTATNGQISKNQFSEVEL